MIPTMEIEWRLMRPIQYLAYLWVGFTRIKYMGFCLQIGLACMVGEDDKSIVSWDIHNMSMVMINHHCIPISDLGKRMPLQYHWKDLSCSTIMNPEDERPE